MKNWTLLLSRTLISIRLHCLKSATVPKMLATMMTLPSSRQSIAANFSPWSTAFCWSVMLSSSQMPYQMSRQPLSYLVEVEFWHENSSLNVTASKTIVLFSDCWMTTFISTRYDLQHRRDWWHTVRFAAGAWCSTLFNWQLSSITTWHRANKQTHTRDTN